MQMGKGTAVRPDPRRTGGDLWLRRRHGRYGGGGCGGKWGDQGARGLLVLPLLDRSGKGGGSRWTPQSPS
ncbi:hypothetical protein GUJ93_ZPchr0006g45745 [Zizania palustris]|uniref:Uncharacterized protein n=1 Tax=Zizania palustris TaxID=103762 RepID=A0A8J5VX46_ZIZPA|nr:hypothetical protein GUJ93_ZPchr0006g45745 [Zizania palustris]